MFSHDIGKKTQGTVSLRHMGIIAVSLPSTENSAFSLQSLCHCHPVTFPYFLPVYQNHCWPIYFTDLPKTKKRGESLMQRAIKGNLICVTLYLLYYASLNKSAIFTLDHSSLALFPLAKFSIFPTGTALQEKNARPYLDWIQCCRTSPAPRNKDESPQMQIFAL